MKLVTNNKTGKVYILLHERVIDATNDKKESEVVMVEYMCLEGNRYVRTREEFSKKFTVRSHRHIKYVAPPEKEKDPDHW